MTLSKNNTAISRNFNFQRFWMLLVHYITGQRKQIILISAVMMGLFLVGSIFNTLDVHTYSMGDTNLYYVEGHFLIVACLWGVLFACISASFSFSTLKTKEGRLNTLMLPASMLEKFLVRIVVHSLLYLMLFMLIFCISDILRVIMTNIYGYSEANLVIFSEYVGYEHIEYYGMLLTHCLLLQACYTLGSVIMPRYSFLITTLVLLFGPFFMLFNGVSRLIFKLFSDDLILFTNIAEIVVSILLYYIVWLIFRRTQLQ